MQGYSLFPLVSPFFLFYTLITSVIRGRTDQELLGQVNRFSAVLATEGVEALKGVAVIEAQAAGVKKVFFRFVALNGQAFSSSNVSYWQDIVIRRSALEQLFGGSNYVFETIAIPNRKEEVRILYAMLGPTIILQVGQAMEKLLPVPRCF